MKKLSLGSDSPIFSETFRIQSIAVREDLPPWIVNRTNGTDSFLFMVFHHPVELFYDGALRKVPAGTTILWRPWKKHYYGNPKKKWSHTWMHCSGTLVEKSLKSGELILDRPLDFNAGELLEKYVRSLYFEILTFAFPDIFIMESLFELLIRELIRGQRKTGTAERVAPLFRQLREALETRIAHPISLEEMARMTHLSVSQFSLRFRQYFGVSPVQFLLHLRMRRACLLLTEPNLNIQEIAYALGYENPLYFSKQFRSRLGKSPSEYRKVLRSPAGIKR